MRSSGICCDYVLKHGETPRRAMLFPKSPAFFSVYPVYTAAICDPKTDYAH